MVRSLFLAVTNSIFYINEMLKSGRNEQQLNEFTSLIKERDDQIAELLEEGKYERLWVTANMLLIPNIT